MLRGNEELCDLRRIFPDQPLAATSNRDFAAKTKLFDHVSRPSCWEKERDNLPPRERAPQLDRPGTQPPPGKKITSHVAYIAGDYIKRPRKLILVQGIHH